MLRFSALRLERELGNGVHVVVPRREDGSAVEAAGIDVSVLPGEAEEVDQLIENPTEDVGSDLRSEISVTIARRARESRRAPGS